LIEETEIFVRPVILPGMARVLPEAPIVDRPTICPPDPKLRELTLFKIAPFMFKISPAALIDETPEITPPDCIEIVEAVTELAVTTYDTSVDV
jgi:hypothetical protein